MKKLLTLVLASCLSFAASAQIPQAGLVAYYPFKMDANNAADTTLNLTVTGAVLTTDRFGTPDNAYLFNGTSDYMEVSATGMPLGNSPRTVSAWFNLASWPDNYYSSVILGYGDPVQSCNSTYGTLLWNYPAGSPLQLGTWKACGGFFQDTRITNNYSLNTWYHLAATYDGAGNENVYLNGVLIGSNSIPLLNTPSTGSIFRLGVALAPNGWFDGKLDDIAIYDRALSTCEIYSLYDENAGGSFTTQPTSVGTQVGSNATFTAQSSNIGSQYQWQQNSGMGFMNLSNAGPYSGVNTNTLTVNSATAAMSNYQFRCILLSGMTACNDTSATVVLSVVPTSVVSTNATTFSIQPNPFSNEIVATATQANFGGKTTLELSDITGRIVGRQIAEASQNELRMQTGALPTGVYFVRMYRDNALVKVQKFIKQ